MVIEIDIVIFVILLLVMFINGWYFREWHAVRTVNKYLDEMDNVNLDKIMSVYVEKANDGFNVFDSKTGAFITFVMSKEEMIEVLKQKFPNTILVMNKENAKVFE